MQKYNTNSDILPKNFKLNRPTTEADNFSNRS